MFVVVPPLKLTRPYDLQTPLAQWLDEDSGVFATQQKPNFRSMECGQDLARLAALRNTIVHALQSKTSYKDAVAVLDSFYEYHAGLVQCEAQGLCTEEMASPLELEWASALLPGGLSSARNSNNGNNLGGSNDDHNEAGANNLSENNGNSKSTATHSSLTWERVNILWNIVALEAYEAATQDLTTRVGWTKAASHLEKGAGILRHLRNDVMSNYQHNFGHAVEFSFSFLMSWEALLVAEAQRASYEAFRCAARPRHFMLAKLATAAVPLYGDCEKYCQEETLLNDIPQFLDRWNTYVRSWGVWMKTKAEHHQACVHRDKRQLGLEVARLEKALKLGGTCRDWCDDQTARQLPQHQHQIPGFEEQHCLEALSKEVAETMHEMESRHVEASQEQEQNGTAPGAAPVAQEDLPEIAPQLQVKVNQALEKLLPPLEPPLFSDIMNPLVRRYVDLFLTEMDKLLFQMTSVAEEKTESARKALATVNLPHSLTAYRQEQAGGGIPDDLWARVQAVQKENRVERLKQDLWELRDIADAARHTYKLVENQLEDDLAMDELFREHHPNFEGHDAAEVQRTFRTSLENYDRLLVTAQDGDSVLLRRLEMLDTDPKYKLLQFQKSQLDRLLPGTGRGGPAIDTSVLSKLLVELSVLFREREMILNTMREELKNYDIHSRLCEVDLNDPDAEREFRRILIEAKESFNEIAYDIQENIAKQTDLVQTILVQNQTFMEARDTMQSSSSSDSCIVMIEDAIEEIDQLSKHLKEGKDFYDVVIPKLEKLKLQVGDVSARLTVERCEYEDNARRNEQELEDARMAASFGRNSTSGNNGNDNDGGDGNGGPPVRRGSDVARTQARPGVEQVSHGVPQVRVDDEKVASLVAMDFDPEKVVAALKKYDNNVEQALNELLSC